MNYEEAIKTIKIAKADVEWNYPMDYQEAFDIAIDCIDKQIPKKPIEKDEGWIRWFCPTCNSQVGAVMERKYHFCDECGQAIDWKEV